MSPDPATYWMVMVSGTPKWILRLRQLWEGGIEQCAGFVAHGLCRILIHGHEKTGEPVGLVTGVLWTRGAPTVATEGAKGRVGLTGAVDRRKDRVIALLRLKRSSA